MFHVELGSHGLNKTSCMSLFVFVSMFLFLFQLAVQWQNMLEESFSQHLVTLKSCSAQQQSSVKVRL